MVTNEIRNREILIDFNNLKLILRLFWRSEEKFRILYFNFGNFKSYQYHYFHIKCNIINFNLKISIIGHFFNLLILKFWVAIIEICKI